MSEDRLAKLEARIAALDAGVHAHWREDEERQALRMREYDKFEQDVQRRFESVNEFRRALGELGENMATRRELESVIGNRIRATFEAIEGLRRERTLISQASDVALEKSEQAQTQAISKVDLRIDDINKRIAALERGESAGLGLRQGATELKASTVAVIGAIATIALVVLYFAHP